MCFDCRIIPLQKVSNPWERDRPDGGSMMRKTFIALFALAAVGLIQSTVTSSRGGDGGSSQWAIGRETLNLFDAARQRPVAVDIAVRRDYEMKADAGYWKIPVAIISNGNTVKNTEYSFLANVFAARGYLVASIQQDLPTDPPLMTKVGLPYVGREGVYERSEAN